MRLLLGESAAWLESLLRREDPTLELLIGLLQEDHAKQSGNPRQRPSQTARQALQRTSAQTSLHNGYGWQFKLERMASSHAHTKLATREWLWMFCLMLYIYILVYIGIYMYIIYNYTVCVFSMKSRSACSIATNRLPKGRPT